MAALTVAPSTLTTLSTPGTTVYDPVVIGHGGEVIAQGVGVAVTLDDITTSSNSVISVDGGATLTLGGVADPSAAPGLFLGNNSNLVLATQFATSTTLTFTSAATLTLTGANATYDVQVIGFGAGSEIKIDGSVASYAYTPTVGQETSDGFLSITGTDGATRSVHLFGDYTHAPFVFNTAGTGDIEIACFARGTRLAVPGGYRPVEMLRPGSTVLTADGRDAQVKWVGHRAYAAAPGSPVDCKVAPVRILQAAFAPGRPSRDLWVSPEHAIFVDGALIPARHLINGCTVVQDFGAVSVEYFHVELDRHDILLAEGLACESWLDTGNRHMFDHGGVRLAQPAVDAATAWRDHACAPLVEGGWELDAVRLRLIDQALATGWAVTRDADFAIVADGQRVVATRIDAQRCRFDLPACVTSVVLASRAAVPAEIVSGSADERALGVVFGSLTLRCGGIMRHIGADDPRLVEGFHEVERSNTGCWRWTSGAARLPESCFAGFDGPISAELYIPATSYYLARVPAAELLTA